MPSAALLLPEEQARRLRYGMSVVSGKRSGEGRPPVAQASRLHLSSPVTPQKVWPPLRFGALGVPLGPRGRKARRFVAASMPSRVSDYSSDQSVFPFSSFRTMWKVVFPLR